MTTTVLLDGDIYAYQASAAYQSDIDWGDVKTRITDLDGAKERIEEKIDKVMSTLNADNCIVCLSDDEKNWRKTVLPTYKGNRKGTEKPELLYILKGWLATQYESFKRPWLEADDVMGILSTGNKIKGTKVIVSIDKDMKSIPGYLYNPDKDDNARLISERAADYYFYTQCITGDPTDGYTGCPGLGAKAAEKYLDEFAEMEPDGPWAAVIEAYASKGYTEEFALQQARVARICRVTDYNFKTKEVILWQPAAQ